jgi:hypothetical protein
VNGCDNAPGHRHGHECATCGDRADRAVIVALDGGDARVELDDGSLARVAVDLIEGAEVGTRVLVHRGVALAAVAEASR